MSRIIQVFFQVIFKAIPHNYCRADAQSDFSSDCIKNDAGILAYVKEFLCDMAENLQADVRQRR